MEKEGRNESAHAAGLRALFGRLTKYKVLIWGPGSDSPVDGRDREVASIEDAHVVSSLHGANPENRHAVVLDIDHPTWLVKSSTPGHYHLYIDVPDGISWSNYAKLLRQLAACNVIEEGYFNASLARGHSDVRLPWVHKPGVSGNPAPLPDDTPAVQVAIDIASDKPGAVTYFTTTPDSDMDRSIVEELTRREQIRLAARRGV